MKKIMLVMYLFFMQNIGVFADEEVYPIEKKILKFDADNDKKIDTIIYTFQKSSSRNATVNIEIKPTSAKPIKFKKETYVYFAISNCSHGCIKIETADWGRWSEGEIKYYKYSPKKRSWFLKEAKYDYPHFDEGNTVPTLQRDIVHASYDMSERIDGKIVIDFPKRALMALEQKSKKMTDRFSESVTTDYMQYYLDHFPLSKKTVTHYNNIAYYFEKKDRGGIAIFLLEKIIKKFPNRVVAYLNLGDAYYQYEDDNFKKMYKKYIKLMTDSKKYDKIPKRVFKRVSS